MNSNFQRNPFLLPRKITDMPKIIEAVYENGVFKPLQKVDLREGEKVKIIAGNLVERLRKYRVKVDSDIVAEFISERR
ncbi:MAG: Putative antitoxin [Archaeoglobus fulgidus]|nr:MAG: Putative antitoxin [Archaeoglobus fulgidus]